MSADYHAHSVVFLSDASRLTAAMRRTDTHMAAQLYCGPHEVVSIHYRHDQAAAAITAFADLLHKALQQAELPTGGWDAQLRVLDALLDTALGRRAEAFHVEHGDPMPLLPTDHVADEVTEEVS